MQDYSNENDIAAALTLSKTKNLLIHFIRDLATRHRERGGGHTRGERQPGKGIRLKPALKP